jgi:hypothetical protein
VGAEMAVGTTNVVRFPVEQRACPSLELLYEIAPGVWDVLVLAEACGLERPDPELRHAADRAMAEHILNHVDPQPGAARKAALRALLKPVVETAVKACREARQAAREAAAARQRLAQAWAEGGYWLAPIEERAAALTEGAARLMLQAHVRAEEARGGARAVRLASKGETWTAYDPRPQAEALFVGNAAAAAG